MCIYVNYVYNYINIIILNVIITDHLLFFFLFSNFVNNSKNAHDLNETKTEIFKKIKINNILYCIYQLKDNFLKE
jgi:hypothetical protein